LYPELTVVEQVVSPEENLGTHYPTGFRHEWIELELSTLDLLILFICAILSPNFRQMSAHFPACWSVFQRKSIVENDQEATLSQTTYGENHGSQSY
jgi:hypothetical protein